MNIMLKIFLYIILISISLICILPFYFMIVCATQSNLNTATLQAIFPGNEFLNNFDRLIHIVPVFSAFKNSIIVTVPATLLSAFFGSLTAYGFAKYKFKGKNYLFSLLFISLIVPQQICFIGFYKICVFFDITNTLWPLIIPSIANPLFVFFLRYYIQYKISDSMMAAARIDGCSEYRIYHSIVLPNIIPGIATMSMFTFISVWNSYLIPITILQDINLYTVPIMTALSKGLYGNDYGAIYAAIAVFTTPVIIVYLLCSRMLIKGLRFSAVKVMNR